MLKLVGVGLRSSRRDGIEIVIVTVIKFYRIITKINWQGKRKSI